jgi:hypothetical protein
MVDPGAGRPPLGTVLDDPSAPVPSASSSPSKPLCPRGQWVYTAQYGWVFMPYEDTYAYLPPGPEGKPLEYVYQPARGWTWVVAPWMWGLGPWPYFGEQGPLDFGWYERGLWRTPWRFHLGSRSRGPSPRRATRQGRARAPRRSRSVHAVPSNPRRFSVLRRS